jgi:hypothetical protein
MNSLEEIQLRLDEIQTLLADYFRYKEWANGSTDLAVSLGNLHLPPGLATQMINTNNQLIEKEIRRLIENLVRESLPDRSPAKAGPCPSVSSVVENQDPPHGH